MDQRTANGVSQPKWGRNVVALVTKEVTLFGHTGSSSAWRWLISFQSSHATMLIRLLPRDSSYDCFRLCYILYLDHFSFSFLFWALIKEHWITRQEHQEINLLWSLPANECVHLIGWNPTCFKLNKSRSTSFHCYFNQVSLKKINDIYFLVVLSSSEVELQRLYLISKTVKNRKQYLRIC